MILKIAICDDNEKDVEVVKQAVLTTAETARKQGCTYQIQTFQNGNEVVKCLDTIKDMHLLLLDIDMPGIDGLEVAKKLENLERRVKVIFVTNRSDLVFTAIHYRPFRFIRKERIRDEISEAMYGAIEETREQSLFGELSIEKDEAEIRICDITYLESQGHYVIIHYRNKELQTIRAKLSDFIERLEKYGFVRTHIGYVVNIRDMYTVTSKQVMLDDHTTIPISRKYADHVKKFHANYVRRTFRAIS